MMMFLAKMIEEQKEKNYEDVYGFIDDFIHMPKAAKGTAERIIPRKTRIDCCHKNCKMIPLNIIDTMNVKV